MSDTPKGGGSGLGDQVAVLAAALLSGDRADADVILRQRAPLSAHDLDELVVPALQSVGAGATGGQVSLDKLYLALQMCRELVAQQLAPGRPVRPDQPKIAIGVLEDGHVLGSQLVQAVLAAAGYEVTDWGARLTVSDIAARAVLEGTEVVLVSVLMLRAALRVAELPRALADSGTSVTLVVGGAPFRFDPELAGEVGSVIVAREATDILAIMADISDRVAALDGAAQCTGVSGNA